MRNNDAETRIRSARAKDRKPAMRGVIFDLDGVVADSHPAHKHAWRTLLTALGKPASDHDLEYVVEGHKRTEILRHFLGDLSADQISFYSTLKEAMFNNAAIELKTINGLNQFLGQIEAAGLSCALASSAGRVRVQNTLLRLNLKHHFQAVVSGDEVANGKPDPAIFHLAASRLDLTPGEVLVCEDATNGVRAAKEAGMKCLALATPGRAQLLRDAGADHVVVDFDGVHIDQLQRLFFPE